MKNIYEHIIAEQKQGLAAAKDLLNQAINIIGNIESEVIELEIRLFKNGKDKKRRKRK